MNQPAAMLSMILAALTTPVVAAPNDAAAPAVGARQPPGARPPDALVNFGLCSGPTNASAFPTSPVPVVNGRCDWYQEFKSVSPDASYGGSCGGYTTAFGPQGDFKRNWTSRRMTATWGDAPLTAATCGAARISAVAWGYRCDSEACSTGAWERLGPPASRKGTWNAKSKVCYIDVSFGAPQKDWQTISIDAIATLTQSGQAVRHKVAATLRGTRSNAQCLAGTDKAYDTSPPMQAASQAHLEKKLP